MNRLDIIILIKTSGTEKHKNWKEKSHRHYDEHVGGTLEKSVFNPERKEYRESWLKMKKHPSPWGLVLSSIKRKKERKKERCMHGSK